MKKRHILVGKNVTLKETTIFHEKIKQITKKLPTNRTTQTLIPHEKTFSDVVLCRNTSIAATIIKNI